MRREGAVTFRSWDAVPDPLNVPHARGNGPKHHEIRKIFKKYIIVYYYIPVQDNRWYHVTDPVEQGSDRTAAGRGIETLQNEHGNPGPERKRAENKVFV
jgi:hypothetical protein